MSETPANDGASAAPLYHPTQEEIDAAFRFHGRVTGDLIAVFDQHGRILFVNEAAGRVLGIDVKQCHGEQLFEFIHPDDRDAARASFARWRTANREALLLIETRVLARVGELRHLHWTVAPYRAEGDPEVRFYVSHARDVTTLVNAAERLRKSETRHRALCAGSLDPMITIDAVGVVHEASLSVETVFGYLPEELIGRNISLLMTEPHASQHDAYLVRYRETGETGILGRTRRFDVRRKDGKVIPVELSVSRIDVPGEAAPLFVGSFRDISARVRAERDLAESEARMRAIFDQEYQFVGLLSPDGALLEINRSALRSIGAARSEVVGRPFWETPWWSPLSEQRDRLRESVAAAAAGEFVRFEVSFVDSEGARRWVDFSLKPIRDEEGVVHYLLPEGHDISSFKLAHAREMAMQAALAEIGESASLLAHEIKNPLTAVNLALRAVADRLGEDQRSVLEDLSGRLARLESTMRRTLSFARPLALQREPCEVRDLLDDVTRLFEPELRAEGIQVEVECPSDLPRVSADRARVEEVLQNLVRNAREALGEGGTLRIAAELDGRSNVLVSIEDDGPGIPPEIRSGLFKPFVTSKPGGTGLGLAIARKIVREHGGEMDVRRSELGGACFWIRLPVAKERSDRVRTSAPASA